MRGTKGAGAQTPSPCPGVDAVQDAAIGLRDARDGTEDEEGAGGGGGLRVDAAGGGPTPPKVRHREHGVRSVLEGGRLPRTTRPVGYDLVVAPKLPESRLKGTVVIDVECLGSPTSEIWLHSDAAVSLEDVSVLAVDTPSSPSSSASLVLAGSDTFVHDQAVKLKLSRDLDPGEKAQIRISFSTLFSGKLVGFYRAPYVDAGTNKFLGVTHFWPTEARRMFPCYDEPDLKANFTVRIQRPHDLTALSNMPVESSEELNETLLGEKGVQDNFETTPKMSTYLLAMALSDFGHIVADCDESNQTSNLKKCSTLVRVWMPLSLREQGKLAVSITPGILRFYEDLFSIPYPLPKMDLFVAPDLAYGAMENWGLITYRAQRLLFDPAVSTVKDQIEVTSTITHEVSHQWFGNLVTPKWWTDLWLNEGFASYMEVIPIQELFPRWNVGGILHAETLRGVLFTDSLKASHPISREGVSSTAEILELFDDISYRKGSSLIRMLVSILGKESFFKALSGYLKAFSFSNAEQDDLWRHLINADGSRLPGNVTLKQVMDSWTLQTGYPVVSVTREQVDGGKDRLKLFQTRFFLHPSDASEILPEVKNASHWWVPVNFAFGRSEGVENNWTDTRPDGWLVPASCTQTERFLYLNASRLGPSTEAAELLPSDAWVLLNVGYTGYYRVNYDEKNWKLLAEQLRKDHKAIDVINRGQILDDSLMLARAGYLNYSLVFDLMSYLPSETEYFPWGSVLGNWEFLLNMLHDDKTNEKKAKAYLLKLMTPILDKIAFEKELSLPAEGQFYEKLDEIWVRNSLLKWGAKLGHKKTSDDARELFANWMKNYDVHHPDKPLLNPNDKETIYSHGIRTGTREQWDFALRHLSATVVASERELLLSALAATEDPDTIGRYVDLAVGAGADAGSESEGGVKKSDAISALLAIGGNNVGRRIVLDLVVNQWERVQHLFGTGRTNVGRILVQASRGLHSAEDLVKVRDFAAEHGSSVQGANLLLQTAQELVSANVRWQAEGKKSFLEALNAQAQ